MKDYSKLTNPMQTTMTTVKLVALSRGLHSGEADRVVLRTVASALEDIFAPLEQSK